jgi:hypothetical protein
MCYRGNDLGKPHKRPDWWEWELELSPHVWKRMTVRVFTEVDLRRMMERATSLHPDVVEGRWVASCRHERRPWEVIVEPDFEQQLLVVVTAYPLYEDTL